MIGKAIIHVSWDVVAMFPNIPTDLGLKMVRKVLNQRKAPRLSTECIIDALTLSLKYNISQFDGTWYRQTKGAAMGPHDSCPYADIAMSYIDEMVQSDANPGRKPDIWLRFRDDCYDAWTGTVEELLEFTAWLNTLNPSIQFTVSYSTEGVEYLDTYVYDTEGFIQTRLYSKCSDTHAYLPPSSCHPYHVCANNPKQIARRVKKLSSEDKQYQEAREKYQEHLTNRGYSKSVVDDAFAEFDNKDRVELYAKKESQQKKRCFPLVTEFNPHLPSVAPILNKHKHLLAEDPIVKSFIPPESVFASYTQPKSIHNLLISSKFTSAVADTTPPSEEQGCFTCGKCVSCEHLISETKTFRSFHCDKTFTIKKSLSCESSGIIYLLNDKRCERSYVGRTLTAMKTRLANYRRHIQTAHKGCEIASHFAECSDKHPIPPVESNETRPEYLKRYNEWLGREIEFVIIDQVNFPSNVTESEKFDILQKSESYWQSQLRTMKRYGGLNVQDERKLVFKNLAKGPQNIPSESGPKGKAKAKIENVEQAQTNPKAKSKKVVAQIPTSQPEERLDRPNTSILEVKIPSSCPGQVIRRSKRIRDKNSQP